MCGIAGLVCSFSPSPMETDAVGRMMKAQDHRGPDASGLRQINNTVLGHRRLSIIDLGPTGAQPMTNEDGSIWVTYNGEIYNYLELRRELCGHGHVFQSRTDTEVLLHGYEEWGVDGLLSRLRGMFAFAIWDSSKGLILARDRLGIKPLYYAALPDRFVFASEVKAILASGLMRREKNADAVAGFLLTGSVPAPLTIARDVRCLLPGTYLTYFNGELRKKQYWDLEFKGQPPDPQAMQSLRQELTNAVRAHLMADVPLGIFLSGGVDSAAVACLASRTGGARLRTLTLTFENELLSEASEARDIARHFDTDHRQVRVTSADFARELPQILTAMDQPTNDGVNTYFVSKAAREVGLKVVLSGLGGDEVFWGYRHYHNIQPALRLLNKLPSGICRLATSMGVSAGRALGRENWIRLLYLVPKPSCGRLYLSQRGFFAPTQAARLLGISFAKMVETADKHLAMHVTNDANGFNYMEIKRYMHDQLLRDSDVFSMAHSLELRVPLLDHRVVQAMAAVEPSRKLSRSVNKPLLVDAADDPIVREAAMRPKRGFTLPMSNWLKQHANILEEMSGESDAVDRKEATAMWKQFRAGRLHWSRAWGLAVLGAKG